MREFKTLFTTFYSYKGGVGRTCALVNTALLRAIKGDRVVVVDFDFEAPGISSYVKELARINKKEVDIDSRRGIVEYLYDAVNSDKIPDLKSCAVTGKDLGLEIVGDIWFIGAGDTSDPSYTRKFSSLNWAEIFEKNQGELLLNNFKKQISVEFDGPDYVFVDSRTGISEIGGVCTRYLADSVIVLSSLNDQNILGTSKVVSTFKESKINTILVASNVPVGLPWGEDQLFHDRIRKFSAYFGSQPDLLVYHYPSLSLIESLPSLFKIPKEENVLREDPLLKSYEKLSEKINSENALSFDNLLDETVNRLFIFDAKRENKVAEHFEFIARHYSNRKSILKTLKLLKSIRKNLDSDSEKNITQKESLALIREIHALKGKYGESGLSMLVSYTLDQASDEIVSYYSSHRKKIEGPLDWFEVLTESSRHEAVVVIVGEKKYSELLNKLTDDDSPFEQFLRAYLHDKLGHKKESSVFFKKFIEHYDKPPSEITYAGIAFTVAYVFAALGEASNARVFINRVHDIIKAKEDGSRHYFVPAKFIYSKNLKEFKKELSNFESELDSLDVSTS